MRKIKVRSRRKEIGIAVILVTAVFVLMWVMRPWKQEEPKVAKVPEVVKVRRAIDGVLVEPGKEHPPIAGVMIENMVEAQPISGIAEANLVFEALTEANITRFLAYFILENTPSESPRPGGGEKTISSPAGGEVRRGGSEIGPVRSARPYYLDWASEFVTLYAHVGSSPAAYELLRKKGVEGVTDLDQWYKSEYFVTKPGRPRPHHLYTSTELLRKAYEKMTPSNSPSERGRNETISPPFEGGVRGGLSPWQFKNDASPDLRGNVNDIRVGYTEPYVVQWLYDKSENRYTRMQWNGAHKDAGGKEIIAKNIAVAFQDMEILDDIGRKKFTTMGEGKGLVFQDGRVVVGNWRKSSPQQRMRFYDGQDKEVQFNAGMTWIEIVPKGYEVKY